MAADDDELRAIAKRYRRFATVEAHGASPAYERLALAVARSPDLLAFLGSMPPDRRQPNLFLAALRHIGGVPRDASAMEAIVRGEAARLKDIMLSRTTQTNEPARCAVLLPSLGALRQPLALIEVGASAGLCLLPDHYGYDYGRHRLVPPGPTSLPIFPCRASPATPLPLALPKVAWRGGLDLNRSISMRAIKWLGWKRWFGRGARPAQAIWPLPSKSRVRSRRRLCGATCVAIFLP